MTVLSGCLPQASVLRIEFSYPLGSLCLKFGYRLVALGALLHGAIQIVRNHQAQTLHDCSDCFRPERTEVRHQMS